MSKARRDKRKLQTPLARKGKELTRGVQSSISVCRAFGLPSLESLLGAAKRVRVILKRTLKNTT